MTREEIIVGNHFFQAAILEAIEERTGIAFPSLGFIDTSDRKNAELVLPILADWVRKVPSEHRAMIYSRFHTKHARPLMRTMVEWLKTETHRLNMSLLYQSIELTIAPSDGPWLWQQFSSLPDDWSKCCLLARIVTCPEVDASARELLVAELYTNYLGGSQLLAISKVDDPRIRAWFVEHLNSQDRGIAMAARRIVNRGKALPRNVSYVDFRPDLTRVLASTEIDLENVGMFLLQLARDFALKLPAAIRQAKFLSRMDTDRFVVILAQGQHGRAYNLYFRLETIDVVEVTLENLPTNNVAS